MIRVGVYICWLIVMFRYGLTLRSNFKVRYVKTIRFNINGRRCFTIGHRPKVGGN